MLKLGTNLRIGALRAGRKAEARTLLTQAVEKDKQNEMAWLWLSGAVDTDDERRICLEKILEINPNNAVAKQGLASLNAASPAQDTELLERRAISRPTARPGKDTQAALLDRIKVIESTIKTFYPNSHAHWLKQRHVKDVPTYLDEDEWPEAVLFGKPNSFGAWGGLWATNKRLLWIHRSLWGLGVQDYTYQKINSIGFSPSGIGVINISLSGQLLSFGLFEVDKKAAPRFMKHVRAKIADISTPASKETAPQPKEPGLITQLERLSQLRSQGMISEEEFEAAKRKLLG